MQRCPSPEKYIRYTVDEEIEFRVECSTGSGDLTTDEGVSTTATVESIQCSPDSCERNTTQSFVVRNETSVFEWQLRKAERVSVVQNSLLQLEKSAMPSRSRSRGRKKSANDAEKSSDIAAASNVPGTGDSEPRIRTRSQSRSRQNPQDLSNFVPKPPGQNKNGRQCMADIAGNERNSPLIIDYMEENQLMISQSSTITDPKGAVKGSRKKVQHERKTVQRRPRSQSMSIDRDASERVKTTGRGRQMERHSTNMYLSPFCEKYEKYKSPKVKMNANVLDEKTFSVVELVDISSYMKSKSGTESPRSVSLSRSASDSKSDMEVSLLTRNARSLSRDRKKSTKEIESPEISHPLDEEVKSPVFLCRHCDDEFGSRYDLNEHLVGFHRLKYNTAVLPPTPPPVDPPTSEERKSILKKPEADRKSVSFGVEDENVESDKNVKKKERKSRSQRVQEIHTDTDLNSVVETKKKTKTTTKSLRKRSVSLSGTESDYSDNQPLIHLSATNKAEIHTEHDLVKQVKTDNENDESETNVKKMVRKRTPRVKEIHPENDLNSVLEQKKTTKKTATKSLKSSVSASGIESDYSDNQPFIHLSATNKTEIQPEHDIVKQVWTENKNVENEKNMNKTVRKRSQSPRVMEIHPEQKKATKKMAAKSLRTSASGTESEYPDNQPLIHLPASNKAEIHPEHDLVKQVKTDNENVESETNVKKTIRKRTPRVNEIHPENDVNSVLKLKKTTKKTATKSLRKRSGSAIGIESDCSDNQPLTRVSATNKTEIHPEHKLVKQVRTENENNESDNVKKMVRKSRSKKVKEIHPGNNLYSVVEMKRATKTNNKSSRKRSVSASRTESDFSDNQPLKHFSAKGVTPETLSSKKYRDNSAKRKISTDICNVHKLKDYNASIVIDTQDCSDYQHLSAANEMKIHPANDFDNQAMTDNGNVESEKNVKRARKSRSQRVVKEIHPGNDLNSVVEMKKASNTTNKSLRKRSVSSSGTESDCSDNQPLKHLSATNKTEIHPEHDLVKQVRTENENDESDNVKKRVRKSRNPKVNLIPPGNDLNFDLDIQKSNNNTNQSLRNTSISSSGIESDYSENQHLKHFPAKAVTPETLSSKKYTDNSTKRTISADAFDVPKLKDSNASIVIDVPTELQPDVISKTALVAEEKEIPKSSLKENETDLIKAFNLKKVYVTVKKFDTNKLKPAIIGSPYIADLNKPASDSSKNNAQNLLTGQEANDISNGQSAKLSSNSSGHGLNDSSVTETELDLSVTDLDLPGTETEFDPTETESSLNITEVESQKAELSDSSSKCSSNETVISNMIPDKDTDPDQTVVEESPKAELAGNSAEHKGTISEKCDDVKTSDNVTTKKNGTDLNEKAINKGQHHSDIEMPFDEQNLTNTDSLLPEPVPEKEFIACLYSDGKVSDININSIPNQIARNIEPQTSIMKGNESSSVDGGYHKEFEIDASSDIEDGILQDFMEQERIRVDVSPEEQVLFQEFAEQEQLCLEDDQSEPIDSCLKVGNDMDEFRLCYKNKDRLDTLLDSVCNKYKTKHLADLKKYSKHSAVYSVLNGSVSDIENKIISNKKSISETKGRLNQSSRHTINEEENNQTSKGYTKSATPTSKNLLKKASPHSKLEHAATEKHEPSSLEQQHLLSKMSSNMNKNTEKPLLEEKLMNEDSENKVSAENEFISVESVAKNSITPRLEMLCKKKLKKSKSEYTASKKLDLTSLEKQSLSSELPFSVHQDTDVPQLEINSKVSAGENKEIILTETVTSVNESCNISPEILKTIDSVLNKIQSENISHEVVSSDETLKLNPNSESDIVCNEKSSTHRPTTIKSHQSIKITLKRKRTWLQSVDNSLEECETIEASAKHKKRKEKHKVTEETLETKTDEKKIDKKVPVIQLKKVPFSTFTFHDGLRLKFVGTKSKPYWKIKDKHSKHHDVKSRELDTYTNIENNLGAKSVELNEDIEIQPKECSVHDDDNEENVICSDAEISINTETKCLENENKLNADHKVKQTPEKVKKDILKTKKKKDLACNSKEGKSKTSSTTKSLTNESQIHDYLEENNNTTITDKNTETNVSQNVDRATLKMVIKETHSKMKEDRFKTKKKKDKSGSEKKSKTSSDKMTLTNESSKAIYNSHEEKNKTIYSDDVEGDKNTEPIDQAIVDHRVTENSEKEKKDRSKTKKKKDHKSKRKSDDKLKVKILGKKENVHKEHQLTDFDRAMLNSGKHKKENLKLAKRSNSLIRRKSNDSESPLESNRDILFKMSNKRKPVVKDNVCLLSKSKIAQSIINKTEKERKSTEEDIPNFPPITDLNSLALPPLSASNSATSSGNKSPSKQNPDKLKNLMETLESVGCVREMIKKNSKPTRLKDILNADGLTDLKSPFASTPPLRFSQSPFVNSFGPLESPFGKTDLLKPTNLFKPVHHADNLEEAQGLNTSGISTENERDTSRNSFSLRPEQFPGDSKNSESEAASRLKHPNFFTDSAFSSPKSFHSGFLSPVSGAYLSNKLPAKPVLISSTPNISLASVGSPSRKRSFPFSPDGQPEKQQVLEPIDKLFPFPDLSGIGPRIQEGGDNASGGVNEEMEKTLMSENNDSLEIISAEASGILPSSLLSDTQVREAVDWYIGQKQQITANKPGELTASKPGELTASKPGELTANKPGEPTSSKPAEPTTSKQGQLTTSTPGELTAAKPGELATDKSEELTASKQGELTTTKSKELIANTTSLPRTSHVKEKLNKSDIIRSQKIKIDSSTAPKRGKLKLKRLETNPVKSDGNEHSFTSVGEQTLETNEKIKKAKELEKSQTAKHLLGTEKSEQTLETNEEIEEAIEQEKTQTAKHLLGTETDVNKIGKSLSETNVPSDNGFEDQTLMTNTENVVSSGNNSFVPDYQDITHLSVDNINHSFENETPGLANETLTSIKSFETIDQTGFQTDVTEDLLSPDILRIDLNIQKSSVDADIDTEVGKQDESTKIDSNTFESVVNTEHDSVIQKSADDRKTDTDAHKIKEYTNMSNQERENLDNDSTVVDSDNEATEASHESGDRDAQNEMTDESDSEPESSDEETEIETEDKDDVLSLLASDEDASFLEDEDDVDGLVEMGTKKVPTPKPSEDDNERGSSSKSVGSKSSESADMDIESPSSPSHTAGAAIEVNKVQQKQLDRDLLPHSYCFYFNTPGKVCKNGNKCKFKHDQPTKEALVKHWRMRMDHYMRQDDLERSLVFFDRLAHVEMIHPDRLAHVEMIHPDIVMRLFAKCHRAGNVNCLCLIKYMYNRQFLNVNVINQYIYMCGNNQSGCVSHLWEVFQRMVSLNIQPSNDAMYILLRAFTDSEQWDRLWQVMLYCNEMENFVVPTFCQEKALQAMLNEPGAYFNYAVQFLFNSDVERLQRLDPKLLQEVISLSEKSGQIKLFQSMKKVMSSRSTTPRPRTPVTPFVEGPGEEEEEEYYENEETVREWMNKFHGLQYSRNWDYLAELYLKRSRICTPIQDIYINKIIDVIKKQIDVVKKDEIAVKIFDEFLRHTFKRHEIESSENELVRIDYKGLAKIGNSLLLHFAEKQSWLNGFQILAHMVNANIDYVKLCGAQREVARVAMETCLQCSNPDAALQVLKETTNTTLEASLFQFVCRLFPNLIQQLQNLMKFHDCVYVLSRAYFVVFREPPQTDMNMETAVQNNTCELLKVCLAQGDVTAAVKIFSLWLEYKHPFVIDFLISRQLLVAFYGNHYEEAARNVFEMMKRAKLYGHPEITDTRTVLIPKWASSQEMYIIVNDYLKWLYNDLCNRVLENVPLTQADLQLSICFWDSLPPKDEQVPFLHSVAHSVAHLQKMAADVLSQLVPSVGSIIQIDGNILLEPGSLERWLTEMDKKSRRQGLRFSQSVMSRTGINGPVRQPRGRGFHRPQRHSIPR